MDIYEQIRHLIEIMTRKRKKYQTVGMSHTGKKSAKDARRIEEGAKKKFKEYMKMDMEKLLSLVGKAKGSYGYALSMAIKLKSAQRQQEVAQQKLKEQEQQDDTKTKESQGEESHEEKKGNQEPGK